MLGSTHLLFSFLFGSFLMSYLHVGGFVGQIIFAALLLVGAFLPDTDLHMPGVKHRGIFHTIWPIILILIANFFLAKYLPFSIAALAIGYGSHLVADAMTPFGIAPLHPLSKFEIKGPIKTGGIVEHILAAIILAYLLVR
jgi:membrane-bound metal-dependent hydrolase YbcI (DUF457 family)